MPVFQTLFEAYRDEGLEPLTGYNPWHFFNWRDAPFTVFIKDGDKIRATDQGGLALQEVMFLENLGPLLSPQNCLVIGNAFGWSTVATALTFADAKTVGMDNFPVKEGLALTKRILGKLDLNGTARLGASPDDVAAICAEEFDAPVDFVLIDAEHTNDAIVIDMAAARAQASDDCVYLFHDVLNFNMLEGFQKSLAGTGLEGRLLTKTPSGMAIAYNPGTVSEAFRAYIDVFADDLGVYQSYRDLARQAAEGKNPFLMDPE